MRCSPGHREAQGARRDRERQRFAVAVVTTGGCGRRSTAGGFGTRRSATRTRRENCCPTTSGSPPRARRPSSRTVGCCPATLSPNGKHQAAYSWNDFTGFLTIFDKLGNVVQQLGTGVGTDAILGDGTVAADGPDYFA